MACTLSIEVVWRIKLICEIPVQKSKSKLFQVCTYLHYHHNYISLYFLCSSRISASQICVSRFVYSDRCKCHGGLIFGGHLRPETDLTKDVVVEYGIN
ncbi:Bgt-20590 [Blumeria graminis f. sp. tritici]|uniref:Bgt-20590 n=2 Tax=Blumeria graminis f. sp. tritici TaxID=62690 RepID=A0A381L8B7_BLUGR|nr:Bgt-20590 [Blumeria graminis f. sp. tritici]